MPRGCSSQHAPLQVRPGDVPMAVFADERPRQICRCTLDARLGRAPLLQIQGGMRVKSIDVEICTKSATKPTCAHRGDAGLDLTATSVHTIDPGETEIVGTGVKLAIPEGYAGFLQPRSGLAAKCGLTVLNSPGLIDSGYRGEIKAILINHGKTQVTINPGDRIAQLVIQPVVSANLIEVSSLDTTDRAEGGLGSTGMLSEK